MEKIICTAKWDPKLKIIRTLHSGKLDEKEAIDGINKLQKLIDNHSLQNQKNLKFLFNASGMELPSFKAK